MSAPLTLSIEGLEPEVNGIVVVHGEVSFLRIYSEYLFFDAASWFERERVTHLEEAARCEDDPREQDFVAEMHELAVDLGRLLEARAFVSVPGMWPNVVNRAKIPLWSVCSAAEMAQYTRLLLEFGGEVDESRRERLDFVLVVARAGTSRLFATPRLKNQLRYVGPVVEAHLLDADSLMLVARQVETCPTRISEAGRLATRIGAQLVAPERLSTLSGC